MCLHLDIWFNFMCGKSVGTPGMEDGMLCVTLEALFEPER